jgi:hypothetical protein
MPSSSVVRLWLISQTQLQRSDYKASMFSGNRTAALGFLMLNSKHISCFIAAFSAELVELGVSLIQKR